MASFSSSIHQQNHNGSNLLLQSSSSLQQQQLMTSTYYSSPPSNNNNNNSSINNMLVCPFEETKTSLLSHFNDNNNGPNFLAAAYNSTNTTVESSSVVTALQQKKESSMERKRKSNMGSSSSSNYSAQSKGKKVKKKAKDEQGINEKNKSNELQKAAAATGAYIHVRARRGQATDSHSLAERVRREKISERMKQLQALVPGCEKVTGKALMLDEIINYVESLQNQVEFLSMKLASINPIFYDFGMDLESFMVRPHQDLNNLPSTITQGMQQMSPIFFTADHYPIFVDNSANNTLLLHHAHISSDIPQDHRQGLWEVDDQRYKATNQSGVSNSGLFSFN